VLPAQKSNKVLFGQIREFTWSRDVLGGQRNDEVLITLRFARIEIEQRRRFEL